MSNLFQSFSNRPDYTLEITQDNLYQDQCEASSRTSLPEGLSRDENSRDSQDDKRPVKKDLLSFMSLKGSESGPADSEISVSNNATIHKRLDVAQPEFRDEADAMHEPESDVRISCHAESIPSNACFGEDVMTFLSEEYGTTFQSQLDISAVLKTTLAPRQVSCQPISRVDSSAIQVSQTLLAPSAQADASKTEFEKTILRNCSGSSTIGSHIEGSDLCPDDSESNQDAFNIISAVENFTAASEFEPTDDHQFSKKPKIAAKPSKIEFSVSQSASTYHKWKSSVSVPEELVRKLPKPAVQPRLPPELAQSHSGPQVLKSSLNIDFKKQATTKAELRFNSLASEKQAAAASVEGATSASTTEKPPVRLVIKTLSRESKPQRVVIISCSSSVRRDTVYHPDDDSDSDSCGQNPAVYGASHSTHSVSLAVPQGPCEKSTDSGHTSQSGKEQSRSLCFCAIQPTVCLSKIDSVCGCTEECDKVLPLRCFAPSTYESLQDLFYRLSACQKETNESRMSFSIESQFSSVKGTKPVHDTPSELRRLSDSSGYCAFSKIPDKRESKNIAALYQSSLQALAKTSTKSKAEHIGVATKHLVLHGQKSKHLARKVPRSSSVRVSSSETMVTGQRLSAHCTKSLKTITRQIRAKRHVHFRRLQDAISRQVHQLSSNLEAARPDNVEAHKPMTPKQLDPLIAASFNRSTGEPSVDHLGRSSLHVAMGSTDEASLRYVIDFYKQKNHLDCKDNDGLTALFLACRNGNTKGASMLLAAGASNSMICPVSGNTPLHEAVSKANLPLVKLLIDFGADLTTENKQNHRAIDLSTSVEISKFLTTTLEAYSCCIPSSIRIIHSDRKLPTIYFLSLPDQLMKVTPCVIKLELCYSLGVSPEYFDVHFSAKMMSHVMENSEILSRIVNPHLKETFEVSTKSSLSTTLLEVDDSFSHFFREYKSIDDKIHSYVPKLTPSTYLTRGESSSDTEPMTDDSLSDVDECEIRKDDIKQIHRSIKKLSVLKQHKRNDAKQSLNRQSFCTDESSTNAELLCHDLAGSPIRVYEEQGSDLCSAAESGSPPCDLRHLFASSLLSEAQAMRVKSEPTCHDDESTDQIVQQGFLSNQALGLQCERSIPDYLLRSNAKQSSDVFPGRKLSSTNIRDSECLAQDIERSGSPVVDINLDLDNVAPRSMLSAYTLISRRKANPLSGVLLKKSVNISTADAAPARTVSVLIKDSSAEPRSIRCLSKSSACGLESSAPFGPTLASKWKSASLPACESRTTPVSDATCKSASACISISGSESDSSPSVFKINVLPRRFESYSTLQLKRDANRSPFSSTRVFRDSKILPPSAMVRILEPTLNSQVLQPAASSHVVASSTTEGAGITSLYSKTKATTSLAQCTEQVHFVKDLQVSASRLFIRGQFKPVRVVVSPSKPASDSAIAVTDPAATPMGPLG